MPSKGTLGNSLQRSMIVTFSKDREHQWTSECLSVINLWDHLEPCSFFKTNRGRCEINHLAKRGVQHMRIPLFLIVREWKECRISPNKVGTGLWGMKILIAFISMSWSGFGNKTNPYMRRDKISSKGCKSRVFQQSWAFSNKNLTRNPLTPLLISQLVVTSDCCKCSAREISSGFGYLSVPLDGSWLRIGILKSWENSSRVGTSW